MSIEKANDWAFDEEFRLVERFLAGDADAFQRIYETHYERVFQIAHGILLDVAEAEDATQEIFTLIYRNLPKFDRRSRLSTWIYRIAVNRSIQQGRASRFRYNHVDLPSIHEVAEPEPATTPADPVIGLALANLSPSDRAMLTLFYWDDLSLSEIAASIGCNENAAKTRLFRARERFRLNYERLSHETR